MSEQEEERYVGWEHDKELGVWVHSKDKCALVNGHCVIHNPSDHHMESWSRTLRASGLVERRCPHGIGHPDPDSVAYFEHRGIEAMGVHGCDGCCAPLEKEEL